MPQLTRTFAAFNLQWEKMGCDCTWPDVNAAYAWAKKNCFEEQSIIRRYDANLQYSPKNAYVFQPPVPSTHRADAITYELTRLRFLETLSKAPPFAEELTCRRMRRGDLWPKMDKAEYQII